MSELALELNRASSRAQIGISSLPFNEWVLPDLKVWTLFFRNGPDYLLRFPELADFAVSADGHEVRSYPVPGIRGDTVEHLT